MKKLRDYLNFDTERFLKGKELMFVSGKVSIPTSDRPDAFKGVLIDLLVFHDPEGINELEKFRVKVLNADEAYLTQFKPHDIVKVVDVQKASVYGDYQNELSVTGRVVKASEK